MSFIRNDKKFSPSIVELIDMYLEDTLIRMNEGLVIGCKIGIKDILSGIGFDINKCALVDMPVCYRNKKCLTHYTVEDLYKNYSGGSGDVLQNIINWHYNYSKNLRDNYVALGKFDLLGALKFDFVNTEDGTYNRLLIDMWSGYACLYDGISLKVYGINRKLKNSSIAYKYRDMGLQSIPTIFLMAVWKKYPDGLELMEREWNIYNQGNNAGAKKLSREKFKKVFLNNVNWR